MNKCCHLLQQMGRSYQSAAINATHVFHDAPLVKVLGHLAGKPLSGLTMGNMAQWLATVWTSPVAW